MANSRLARVNAAAINPISAGHEARHQEVVEILEHSGGRAVNRAVTLQAAELSPSLRHRGGI